MVIIMSLNKAIEYGKEKRKAYTGGKAIDCSCRNHGSCEWCKSNRLYQSNRINEKTKQIIKEYLNNE